MTTTLVDGARALTPRHECSRPGCRVALHLVAGVWRDGGGRHWCWQGLVEHDVVEVRHGN